MIEALRSWLTGIVAATVLVSVAESIIPEGSIRKIARFTGGLALLLVILQPLLQIQPEEFSLDFSRWEAEIQSQQADYEAENEKNLRTIIQEKTEAYISDKADELGVRCTPSVKVEGDDPPCPTELTLSGETSEELAGYIEQELGIPREKQTWKGT
ncbi:stage III sporulation protein AF [Oscillibacter hominis]|uniref:Stage III sporulation protein AF n=1 Tax=Oscillibacter hominis TaxID=2763056 RepID=A0A7G9B7K1_9FIRM|nr:stage III sporulation protein AF [Oscillibacter hominis]QNL45532.1 stage III sporulation protein AF [Oscillibacter hominis]